MSSVEASPRFSYAFVASSTASSGRRRSSRGLQASSHARVRQFLDRVAEPELSQEIDYLQMLTGEVPRPRQ